jgi:hypothetical protein
MLVSIAAIMIPATAGAKSFSTKSSYRSSPIKSAPKSASTFGSFNSKTNRNIGSNAGGGKYSSLKSNADSFSLKFGKTHNDTIKQAYKDQVSKKSYDAFRKVIPASKPMHFPESDLKTYRSRYANNDTFNRLRHDPNAWGSRYQYYQSNQPMTVNGGSDSFGMLSGMFLYSLLNNSASAGEYAFHHQHDDDYLKWRSEADWLAKDNPELKSQLDKLDASKQSLQTKGNTQPNPNWVPDGVPVAATLSEEAIKSSQPDFRVCVGSEAGPYYKVAQTQMLPELVDMVNLNPVTTKGTPDILAKIAAGDCDAGIIQGDAKFDDNQLDVIFKPFLEAGHLACNIKIKGATINEITDQAIWIPKNSGSRMTWDRLVELNPVLGKVNVRDAVNYEEAILKAVQTPGCLFYMAAPHASSIDRLIDRNDLKLIAIDDPLLLTKDLYQSRTLSSSDYRKTIPSSFFSASYIKTIVAPATFVMSNTWKSANPELAAKISLKLVDLENQLKQSVNQK